MALITNSWQGAAFHGNEVTQEPGPAGEGLPEADGVSAAAADEPMAEGEPQRKGPTPEQITAIKAAIQNAQTLQEVAELEAALVSGNVPSQFQVC